MSVSAQKLELEARYRRWGDKALYIKTNICSGEPKNAALTL